MTEKEICRVFSTNLQSYMAAHRMTQTELAHRCGAGQATVSGWMKGTNIPRTPMLKKLTEIFSCELSELLTDGNDAARVTPQRQEAHALIDEMTEDEVSRLLQIARLVRGE